MMSTGRWGISLGATSFLVLSLTACSGDRDATQESEVSSIASPSGTSNILYWQEKTDLIRGACVAGKALIPANCTTSQLKVPVADITSRSTASGQRGVDAVVAAIATEVRNLRSTDPTVVSLNQQIAALTNQKPAVEAAVAAATTQIQTDQKVKTQIDERLAYNNQQLKAIEIALSKTPNDQILLDLQRDLRIDVLQIEAKTIEIAERLTVTKRRLAGQQLILSKIDTDLAAKQNELKLFSDSLDVFSPRLDQLKAQKAEADAAMASVSKVMTFIADGNVVYRGNILPKELVAALAIIDRSFTNATLSE